MEVVFTKQVVTTDMDAYPAGLASVFPNKTLDVLGNSKILNSQSVGICGSRNASPEALGYAYKFGFEAALRGFVVVSGYARGIDRQAHRGALEAGGATIAVLAEGVDSFRMIKELAPNASEDNFAVVSMYPSDASWQSWRAMERNKLIVGLSIGLFVVEASEKGGTINAAFECVRQRKPLWAIAYSKETEERKGNKWLLQEAAIPLRHIGDLKAALNDADSLVRNDVQQLAMNIS